MLNSQKRNDYKYGFGKLINNKELNHRHLAYSKRHILHGSFLIFSKLYFNYYKEPFYPKTFLYYEEAILKLRCDLKSLIMLYSPEYKVQHLQSVSAMSMYKGKEDYNKKTEEQLKESLQIYYRLLKKVEKRSLSNEIKSRIRNLFNSLPWIRGVNKKTVDNREDIENMFDLLSNKLVFEYVPTKEVNKLAVYTAIIGDQDELLNLSSVSENCDYFCITNNKNITSKLWNVIYIDSLYYEELIGLSNNETTLFIKTHPDLFFQNYKHTLWIDHNIDIVGEISSWLLIYNKNNSITMFKNNERDLLSEALEDNIFLEYSENVKISKQISEYYEDGYDESISQVMTNVIYRKNDASINEINNQWWKEIKKHSLQDQLSLNYVLWKNKTPFDLCNLNPQENRYFKIV